MEQKVLKLFIAHARVFLDALEELTEKEQTKITQKTEVETQPAQQLAKEALSKADTVDDEMKRNGNLSGGIPTAEELAGMTFNDLRSLGASLGINARGKRSEIEANILALENKVTKPPVKESSLEKPTLQSEEDVDDAEEKIPDDDIIKICEEMTDEQLQETLKSVGLRTNGKRAALIDRIVKAVADGVLDWSDDDESETEENNEADETENESDEENGADDEYDVLAEFPEFSANDADASKITEERLAKLEEIDALYESDEEEEDEKIIDEVLIGHFGSKFKVKSYDLSQKTRIYFEIMKLFVDDDGDEHVVKEGYYLNGELYCCAKPINEEGKCVVCGDVYDVDDE